MARQGNSNSFALLGDEEGDDISNLIDRVSEMVISSLPLTVEKKQKNRTDTANLATGHVEPSDSVKGEKGRGRGGRGQGRGRGAGRFGNGDDRANSYEQNHGGSDGHQRNYRGGNDYGGSDTYQRKYGGVDGSQSENGGGRSYQRNNGGEDGYRKYGGVNGSQRNYGSDSAQNLGDDSWQGNGRGRGRGRGGGRGRRSGFDETNASVNEVEVIGSQQIQISIGWELVNEFEGNRHGNEGQSIMGDERQFKNGNRSSGSGRRGYTGGHSYGGREGRNGNGEFSNNSETKNETQEDVDGEKGNAVNGDDSGEAEGKASVTVTTEVVEDAESKQETIKDSSENVKEEEDNDMTLEEYEKVLLEKRKALEAMKNNVERKVIFDKDFESMQLIEKKKEDSLFIKLNSDKDKLKKKEIFDKEEKVRKLVSINEFLKPADGEMPMRTFARGRGGSGRGSGGNSRGRGERSGFRGAFSGQRGRGDASLPLEDPRQFPVLGGAVKV